MPHIAAAMDRLGTETAFDVLARAGQLAAGGRDIVNLGIGQPDFRTPEHIVEAAVKALRDGHHGYTPANGIAPLREAVTSMLARRYDVAVDPDRVLIVPGGKVTMWFAILMLGEPGAEILYPNPGFPIYESAIRYTGATPVPIRLAEAQGFSFSAEEVLAQVTPRTRLIIINSPGNPTGGVVPASELAALARGLAEHPRVVVLSDEIYSCILYDDRRHSCLLRYPELNDRVILLDGWSKTYAMTGWRLGFSVWPSTMIGGATRLAINSHSCVNAAAQYAGIAALDGPQDAVYAMVEAFAERRRRTVDGLNRLPDVRCAEPGGAFYAFPNITGTGFDARTLQDRLLEDVGVATVAGTSFGALGEGFLRISYAAAIDDILRAIDQIGDFLGSERPNVSRGSA